MMSYGDMQHEKRQSVNQYRDELVEWLEKQGNQQPDAFGDGEYERGYNQAVKDVLARVQR